MVTGCKIPNQVADGAHELRLQHSVYYLLRYVCVCARARGGGVYNKRKHGLDLISQDWDLNPV